MGYIPHNAILDTSMMVLYTFYGYDEPLLLSILNNYYSPVSIQNATVSAPFMRRNIDTLTINAQMVNPANFNIEVKSIIRSLDGSVTDSIPLYDDGNHDDGQAGDLLYGGYLPPFSMENEFSVGIKMTDLDNNVQSLFADQARFTTIGPIAINGYYEVVRIPPNKIYFKFELRNDGQTKTAENISARLSTSDPLVSSILGSTQNYGDIDPGQIAVNQNNFGIIYSSLPNSYSLHFKMDIYSDGNYFWSDSTDVLVGFQNITQNLPETYSLKQNYPNPFNPNTTIEFDLPEASQVSLKVFTVTGEEVATIVSDRLSAGTYKYQWDASRTRDLASGVYIYRLQAGSFSQTRKMILMK